MDLFRMAKNWIIYVETHYASVQVILKQSPIKKTFYAEKVRPPFLQERRMALVGTHIPPAMDAAGIASHVEQNGIGRIIIAIAT